MHFDQRSRAEAGTCATLGAPSTLGPTQSNASVGGLTARGPAATCAAPCPAGLINGVHARSTHSDAGSLCGYNLAADRASVTDGSSYAGSVAASSNGGGGAVNKKVRPA